MAYRELLRRRANVRLLIAVRAAASSVHSSLLATRATTQTVPSATTSSLDSPPNKFASRSRISTSKTEAQSQWHTHTHARTRAHAAAALFLGKSNSMHSACPCATLNWCIIVYGIEWIIAITGIRTLTTCTRPWSVGFVQMRLSSRECTICLWRDH